MGNTKELTPYIHQSKDEQEETRNSESAVLLVTDVSLLMGGEWVAEKISVKI
jgi:hypothetical protein